MRIKYFLLGLLWFGVVVLGVGCWVTSSHFEAKVYTELTGKDVTTWQAMWVQLRVIEPAKGD